MGPSTAAPDRSDARLPEPLRRLRTPGAQDATCRCGKSVVPQPSFVGFVDRQDRYDLDVADGVVRGAEIDHLLRLRPVADGRTGQALTAENQAVAGQRRLQFGNRSDETPFRSRPTRHRLRDVGRGFNSSNTSACSRAHA